MYFQSLSRIPIELFLCTLPKIKVRFNQTDTISLRNTTSFVPGFSISDFITICILYQWKVMDKEERGSKEILYYSIVFQFDRFVVCDMCVKNYVI